jgi:hypothetical protein
MTVTTSPMTRAQKFQWFLEKGLAEGVRPLPNSTVESVHALVRSLERRFDVLRTSIDVVDGELRQKLHGSGSPLITVDVPDESDLPRVVARLVEDFRVNRLGRVGGLLAQFYLLRCQDRHWLALVADNVAVDAGFHGVMDVETTRILAGGPAAGSGVSSGTKGLQSSEAAALEWSPKGQEERAKAAAYLRRHFSIAPPRMHFGRPSSGVNEGRYFRCTLKLNGADQIFSAVMEKAGILPSAVILASFTQLMCLRGEKNSCSINVSLDNRHNRELRQVLCATAQRVPVALLSHRTLLAAAADVQRTLAEGHPTYGRYDPFDLVRERVEAQHRRGISLTTDLAFNFVPPPQGWTALIESNGEEFGDGFGPDADIDWGITDEVSYEYGASLSVRWTDPRTARLSIHGDSEVITPAQCGVLLRGVEHMLKRVAAGEDCVVGQVADEVGLRQLDQTTRAHEEIGKRLLGIAAVDHVKIVVEPDEDSGAPRLIARVAVTGGAVVTPFDLREELLKAVDTGEVPAVPDWYEIVGASGGDSSGDGREGAGRPDTTDEEAAVRWALEGVQPELNLDLCYVRAGGSLARYPEFADRLGQRGYIPPDFGLVSGMSTLRDLARHLRRSSR